MTVAIRPMRADDLDRVLVMERDLFDVEAWSRGVFQSELDETTRYYVVAEDAGTGEAGRELVGYAGLCVYPDESFVQTLAVRRDRWGHGIGTRLLRHLVDAAVGRGADVISLEVRADNDRAQRLYRRFGLEPIGVRRRYYQPSGTDAVVMRREGLS